MAWLKDKTVNKVQSEENMGKQQSQKQGLKSSSQKEDRSRDGYAELPASSKVAGAFGRNRRSTPPDKDLSLTMATKTVGRKSKPNRQEGEPS
jgi:hypothetical protein